MPPPSDTLADSISRQREMLKTLLREPLAQAAQACSQVWGDRQALNAILGQTLAQQAICKYLYALDTQAIQISDTISRDGPLANDIGRNRADRPYMNERVPSEGFLLSQAYISLRAKRPSLTAIQIVRDANSRVLGFIGADFDLRNLPLTGKLYDEPTHWRQIKGDPAIRGTVFHQTRSDSQMDINIDTVLGVLEELMAGHGVFHVILHFSSSRAVIWLFDDPYRYRLLDIDALIDPNTCLAYPKRSYPDDALVPRDQIRAVLDGLRELRFMDDMFYLRSGTLNIFNGVVGLTFSCDGSHYLPWDEFLSKGYEFWASGKMLG
ncbi:MAG: PDC sensor domain-containing protein [Thiobacillus sp.]|nr:PDC sensor domain-containing protein [Gammaproteobacteria bacterium]MBU4498608.1 PDC sensor domain-containing protein [Gammaproteobacteria bacterium]MDO9006865.1 PDC sensor domain-containing protein [Thiobacillus sp.]